MGQVRLKLLVVVGLTSKLLCCIWLEFLCKMASRENETIQKNLKCPALHGAAAGHLGFAVLQSAFKKVALKLQSHYKK